MTVEVRRGIIAAVLEIADRQHGVVLGRQLSEAALSRRVLTSLRAEGWLVEIRPGAYSVASAPSDWQEAVAVSLLGGEGTALSHYTAARAHRLPGIAPVAAVHLTVPAPRHPRMAGVSIHRVANLSPSDWQEHRGVRVTTAVRTLVDIAPDLPSGLIATCVDEGLIARLWDLPSLEDAVNRAGYRTGVIRLRQVLAQRISPNGEPDLEGRVIRALACFGPFEVQYQVVLQDRVFVLDIAWPDRRVAVESDGWNTRSRSRSKFDHDRRRNNILAAHGWTVVHLTSVMSDDEMRAAVFPLLMRAAARG